MDTKSYIGKTVEVKIDRPLGSRHPKHGFIYPVNYGYIPNTISGDGEELDCYVLGVFEALEEFSGRCIAVIHRTNDDDDKLVVTPDGKEYSDDAINALVEFQERFFEHTITLIDKKREKSCGCIILKDDKVLLIGARDDNGKLYWSFPKGHQDEGETDVETALRETKEEVGLDVEISDRNPIRTGHLVHNGTVHKEILLFIAEPLNDEIRVQEMEVEKAEWVNIDEAGKYFDGYYSDAWGELLDRIRN